MKHMLALWLAVVLAMTGCAALSPSSDQSVADEAGTVQLGDLLGYYRRLSALPPAEQQHEFALAQAACDRQPTDANRLRLALALVLPRAAWRDDAKALEVLSGVGVTGDGSPTPAGDLALLIDRLIGERQRLLREEQRKAELQQQKMDAYREELRKIDVLQQKLDALREEYKKTEALQQQLEELRAIDRDQRMRATRRSKP